MEGRERREEVGTGDGRDMGSREVGEQKSRCAEGGKVPGLLGMGFEEPQWSDK